MSDHPSDRTVSQVAGARQPLFSGRKRLAVLSGVGVLAAVLMVYGIYSAMHDDGVPTKPVDIGASIGQTVASPPEPVAEKPRVGTKTETKADPEPNPPFQQKQLPVVNYVVLPASAGGSFEVPAPTKEEKARDGTLDRRTAANPAQTRVAFQPTVMPGGKAGPAMHLEYVMMPQTIPCALDTAMDSTLAGPIMCHTTRDVLSPSHIVLLPAGTTVVGSYKNDVRNGQHRLFAFSGNAITQDGIPVPLNSPIADGLGRAGIEGDVDNHYLERFGAAVALTAAQAAIQLGQAALTSGNQTNTNFNFGSGGSGGIETLATEILRQQGSIPPTISVPPGSIVSVVVDHPIDFSEALHVEARR